MGASGDIGCAVAYELAKEGYSLYLHFHKNEKKVLNLQKELANNYPKQDFFVVYLDMLNEAEIENFLHQLFHVDCVIFANGFTTYKLLRSMSTDEIEELWKVHLKTPMLLLQKLEDKLAHSGTGRIVFIGSVYGQMGSAMETVYSTMKAGMEGFAKSYSKEVASLGITVNVVAPGAVDTQMNRQFSEEEFDEIISEIPIGRMVSATEVASAVKFLCSEQQSAITGSVIPVNGGWY
jgi:3-oxoacyl-[acyl-carrier protein] reductase